MIHAEPYLFQHNLLSWDTHAAEYQEWALKFLHDNPAAALFVDAGLGKTIVSLTYCQQKIEAGDVTQALVAAPIRVARQTWPNEIEEWSHLWLDCQLIRAEDDDPEVNRFRTHARERARAGRLTDQEVAAYAKNYVAWRVKAFERFWTAGRSPVFATLEEEYHFLKEAEGFIFDAQYGGLKGREVQRAAGVATTLYKERLIRQQSKSPAPLHVINREKLPWLADLFAERKHCPYNMMFYDESSDLGDHSTERFKSIMRFRKRLDYFIELTATPTAEGYEKLFPQMLLLDNGERLGRNITAYRKAHFVPKIPNKPKFGVKIKPGHGKVISSKVADICLVLNAEDHLPDIETQWADRPRRLRFDSDQEQRYKDFARDAILAVVGEDEPITALTGAALGQKLLQFCSGAVYDGEKKAHAIHDEKLEDLAQLVEELQGEPLLCTYWWGSSLTRLRKRFPKAAVMDRKGSQVEGWNKGKYELLFLHPQGSEFGLNMQKGPGHDIAHFDMFWSYEKWYQIHKRLARKGQTRPVRSWPIMFMDTADQVVMQSQAEKKDGLDDMKRYIQSFRQELFGERNTQGVGDVWE